MGRFLVFTWLIKRLFVGGLFHHSLFDNGVAIGRLLHVLAGDFFGLRLFLVPGYFLIRGFFLIRGCFLVPGFFLIHDYFFVPGFFFVRCYFLVRGFFLVRSDFLVHSTFLVHGFFLVRGASGRCIADGYGGET